MTVTQLIYVSALRGDNEATLGAILESSVRHNQKNEITGMLLYYGGSFLQVLEGERHAVRETYARICLDLRHTTITLLSEEEVPSREFPQWSMGYKHLHNTDLDAFPHHAAHFNFGLLPQLIQATPGLALEMLNLFSQGRFGPNV